MSTADDDVTNSSQNTYSRYSRTVLISAPHGPAKENSSREPRHLRRWASLALPFATALQSRHPDRTFRQHYQNWHAFMLAIVNPETTNAVFPPIGTFLVRFTLAFCLL
jgi:hypothetical protein